VSASAAPDDGARPPPAWSELLEAQAREERRAYYEPRQVLYAIDVDETRLYGEVAVLVREAAPWLPERFRAATVHRYELASLDPADAMILGALETMGTNTRGGATGPAFAGRYFLSGDAAREILPEICWTGRARIARGLAGLDGAPVEWDGAQAYDLVLEAALDAHGALSIGAVLARGTERVSIHAPAVVTASGLAMFDGRIAYVDDRGAFGWVVAVRERGRVPLPHGEVAALVEELAKAERAPRLELPPEHAFEEVRAPMRPCAVMRSPGAGDEAAKLGAWATYDGVSVLLSQKGRLVVDRTKRRLLVRDLAAEEEAKKQLVPAGVRRGRAKDGGWDRVAASRIGACVRALVDAGWRVELDGRAWRGARSLSFAVTTGIDWFDVRVKGDFDGVDLPLPELLAAAKQRRTTVVLADGSTGLLREEHLERVQRWAALASSSSPGADAEALRFRRSQLGILSALADREPTPPVADETFARLRAEIDAFDGIEPRDAPYGFRGTLRAYQRAALGWFAFLRRFGLGGCLADDMGLGKTVQVVALFEERRQEEPRVGPSLVVAPRSLVFHWAQELARFAPDLRVLVHDGAGRDLERAAEHDVVLTTYGLLRRDAEPLAGVAWDYAVLDEAQAIKNPRSAAAVAACALPARHRLALTGTPVENHLGELASIFAFANPGMLGGSRALESLAGGGRSLDVPSRSLLAQALRPVVLRRTKAQVARDLPDRVEQTIVCDLGRDERRLYAELRARARASLSQPAASTMHVLEALLRLRQAACHPGLVDTARRADESAKLEALLAHLESVRAEGRKALVFSQFATLLGIVKDRLEAQGFSCEYLDGSTVDREARVTRFQEDAACSVFLLSLKAGGVGLNLTAADCVFLLDPWWNPAAEAQAIDRAHRIGQHRTVFAYRLLARDTVEEKVAALQREKRALAESLFGETSGAIEGMSREDLELLLS
jgi:superfamily II DNA or RNA helicase